MMSRVIVSVLLGIIADSPEGPHTLSITGQCFPLEDVLADIGSRHMQVTPLLYAAEGDEIALIQEKQSGSVMLLSPSTGLGCLIVDGPRATKATPF